MINESQNGMCIKVQNLQGVGCKEMGEGWGTRRNINGKSLENLRWGKKWLGDSGGSQLLLYGAKFIV